jgi:hypothetical protein
MFEFHFEHTKSCFPISYLKISPDKKDNINLIEHYEEKLVNLKEKINSIINDEIEKLAKLKEINSLEDLINSNLLEYESDIFKIFKLMDYNFHDGKYNINEASFKNSIKDSIKISFENLKDKLYIEISLKETELSNQNLISKPPSKKSVITNHVNFNSECRNNQGQVDFINICPISKIKLFGYGRLKFKEQIDISIEISIYDETGKKYIYKETIEELNEINEHKIIDHFFKRPITLKRSNIYTIIQKNLKDNGFSYNINSRSQSNNDFNFEYIYQNKYIPPNIINGNININNGKFSYFIINILDNHNDDNEYEFEY